jgi:hypothetical protein
MNYWIGVISRTHAMRGVEGGFTQLNHGKRAPLARMHAGDWFAIYSPKVDLGSPDPCQRFTGIGRVRSGTIYQFDMGGGFVPYRLDIDYCPALEAPIQPLIPALSFIEDKQHWGYPFRYGHIKVSEADFRLIASAMGVDISN